MLHASFLYRYKRNSGHTSVAMTFFDRSNFFYGVFVEIHHLIISATGKLVSILIDQPLQRSFLDPKCLIPSSHFWTD